MGKNVLRTENFGQIPCVRKIDAATTHKDWRTPAFTFVKPIIPIS
jgi:hypothetical protein